MALQDWQPIGGVLLRLGQAPRRTGIASWRDGAIDLVVPEGLAKNQRLRLTDLLVWRLLGRLAEPALESSARRLNEEYFHHSLAKVGFHHQMGRWGSCSARRRIHLSHRLLFAPPHLVRAVLLHELAHLGHLNHRPEYWRLLATADPQCRQRRVELARFGAVWRDWWPPRLRRLLATGEIWLQPPPASREGSD